MRDTIACDRLDLGHEKILRFERRVRYIERR